MTLDKCQVVGCENPVSWTGYADGELGGQVFTFEVQICNDCVPDACFSTSGRGGDERDQAGDKEDGSQKRHG